MRVSPGKTFHKEEKIRKEGEFNALFKDGRVYSGSHLQLFLLPRDKGGRKVGFVFSRKVKPGVARNRLRRLLKEAYRLNKHNFVDGYMFLIKGNKPIADAKFKKVELEFLNLIKRAGLLKRTGCFT